MHVLAASFAVLVGAAGWFYLFYSRAGSQLGAVEGLPRNRLRTRLRRVGGLSMLALAAVFYTAFRLTPTEPGIAAPRGAGVAWLIVIVLLAVVLALGLVDVLLTKHLRDDLRRNTRR